MQYRLRTLQIAVGIGPPVLALVWWAPWLFPVTMVWSIAVLIPLAILEESAVANRVNQRMATDVRSCSVGDLLVRNNRTLSPAIVLVEIHRLRG